MVSMTTTSAPFREADVLRDTAGKFSGKDQSAPELTLGEGDYDLANFMQEPPTVAEPFTSFQPVVYTDIDGNDVHATITGFEENGYARIVERTTGTFSDVDDDTLIVEQRYLREDLDVSRDAVQRQRRALVGATQRAVDITKATKAERAGLDSYDNALLVRDQLKVDGRTNWHESHTTAVKAMELAAEDLQHSNHLAPDIIHWASLDGSTDVPDEFTKVDEAVGWEASTQVSAVLRAQIVEQYTDTIDVDEQQITRVNDSITDALDLGTRMSDAVLAADLVDADADAIGAELAEEIFPGVVKNLSQRKKLAYRKAVGAVSEAFETLERYDLLDRKHAAYGRHAGRTDGEAAILARAAAQAFILRHYQPETGLTDAQLDAISTVWNSAVTAHNKAAA